MTTLERLEQIKSTSRHIAGDIVWAVEWAFAIANVRLPWKR